jgi:hypothetical protein
LSAPSFRWRRQFGYLKVGSCLAWYRVLGLLDDGRWVLLGNDSLYEAVFMPTVKEPLEVFDEAGYVKVLKSYEGDVDDVASPCRPPSSWRVVRRGWEGRCLGMYVAGWRRLG